MPRQQGQLHLQLAEQPGVPQPKIGSPLPTPGALITALDTSSNNGLDIGSLLDTYKPRHLITKLYQTVELAGHGARWSVAHAVTARERGCTVGGYVWLYNGISGERQVSDALATAAKAGLELGPHNPLWLDCEDYTDGSYPSLAVIHQAVAECASRGIACGIYTGGWWWKSRAGNTAELNNLPLWAAVYDSNPTLIAPGFGGWAEMAGHQWSGNPVDRSVFRAEFATP